MDKINQLRSQFSNLGIDGLFITNPQNRFYFTGFTGTAGVAVITPTEAIFLTDYRYVEQAKVQTKDFDVVKYQDRNSLYIEVPEVINNLGITKLGFEQEDMTYGVFSRYNEAIDAELVPTSGVIETLRTIKTTEEIELLKASAKIADSAFKHILDFIRPGVTEIEISNELETRMRQLGASGSSFDIIIASGLRGAMPHGVATQKVIESGEMITLDFGAIYKGYISDITRTISVGTPSDEMRKIYDIVLEAQVRSVEAIKPGIHGKDLDSISRDYISEKGYSKYCGNSAGHGIGLSLWEEPFISPKSSLTLQPGMVVTMEPGIYIPGVGGVRIEDDVVITENGNEILTHSPKELIKL
ncbi:M24 family metallopeptidase [Chengkuizengella axinellae]|uniref:Xaa-Pro peptidase family protein n=1 Tax=Chengkuizengella axinellae TaxID=3064388 RepID=A0ABT9J4V3_9BACL|nr:Xaa-Pro peptidase family protein [Chengkuizengella sp. 2205SS18-9]MDP5276497.1 Xaa-Pro peptidase family protein [Chengkuizengella sp. 2205SS18-9]